MSLSSSEYDPLKEINCYAMFNVDRYYQEDPENLTAKSGDLSFISLAISNAHKRQITFGNGKTMAIL